MLNQRMEEIMKIAIPMVGDRFSEHFGEAQQFMVVKTNRSSGRLDLPVVLPAPVHKPGVRPRWLARQQVTSVVASAIGERALTLLANAGIETYLAEDLSSPLELAASCLQGTLPRLDSTNSRCHGGRHHGDDHECHH